MNTTALHINAGAAPRHTLLALLFLATAAVVAAGTSLSGSFLAGSLPRPTVAPIALVSASTSTAPKAAAPRRRAAAPQSLTIGYTAHNGARREAVVLLPARYDGSGEPLPLVISPHGRGATGLSNSRFWGRMPTRGRFAVINPDGSGRRMQGAYSYGYAGHIADLARMPRILARKLPWVRIDSERIYALGSSMGGQETLLLVARHPDLLAGAAAMDSVTDLARRFHQLLDVPSTPKFAERWGAPVGACLQAHMRREVGGTPDADALAYARRSPLALARRIARSGVALQIWWSRKDTIVFDQEHQSQALVRKLKELGTEAPLVAYSGDWAHSKEMHADALLALALQDFGLIPRGFKRVPQNVRRVAVAA